MTAAKCRLLLGLEPVIFSNGISKIVTGPPASVEIATRAVASEETINTLNTVDTVVSLAYGGASLITKAPGAIARAANASNINNLSKIQLGKISSNISGLLTASGYSLDDVGGYGLDLYNAANLNHAGMYYAQ